MRGELKRISISAGEGDQVCVMGISARVYGPVAIHKSTGGRNGCTITHLKSGRAIVLSPNTRVARSFVQRVLGELPEPSDWEFSSQESMPGKTKRVLSRIINEMVGRFESP